MIFIQGILTGEALAQWYSGNVSASLGFALLSLVATQISANLKK